MLSQHCRADNLHNYPWCNHVCNNYVSGCSTLVIGDSLFPLLHRQPKLSYLTLLNLTSTLENIDLIYNFLHNEKKTDASKNFNKSVNTQCLN